ncbi:MAG: aminotransferase class IV [Gaiellaceae bacterium]
MHGPGEPLATASGRADAGAEELVVADSFLVEDGAVRGWTRHWRRFHGSCRAAGASDAQLASFVQEVVATVPRRGRWFPRLEVVREGSGLAPRLRLRPAPEHEPLVRVWCGQCDDFRVAPRCKGPDLGRLASVREDAARRGAGEALLLDEDGRALEGAFSSLLWWDGDTLCAVPDDAPILPGVTRALILELAAEEGIPVATRRPLPSELDGREVWMTSALHGIRAVSGWVGASLSPGPAVRANDWSERLAATREPLAVEALR